MTHTADLMDLRTHILMIRFRFLTEIKVTNHHLLMWIQQIVMVFILIDWVVIS